METLILSQDDMRQIIRAVGLHTLMDTLIDRLTVALAEYDPATTTVPARAGFHYEEPDLGLIEWMPVLRAGENAVVKTVGYHPSNPRRYELPTILATISAYDTATGHLVGLSDATFLTALRTGAASAVATRLLAAPGAGIVGLIGCGAQAVSQLHALARIMPIERVLLYDSEPTMATTFRQRARFLDLELIEAPSANAVASGCDVLCTATSVPVGAGPVFDTTKTRPWLHVNAIGSDFPGKIELPRALLRESLVCPDFTAQAVREGECQQLDPDALGPDLATLVRESRTYTPYQMRRTVFDSTGFAVEDEVALNMLLGYAKGLGLGTWLQIESGAHDPHDPYAFVNDPAAILGEQRAHQAGWA